MHLGGTSPCHKHQLRFMSGRPARVASRQAAATCPHLDDHLCHGGRHVHGPLVALLRRRDVAGRHVRCRLFPGLSARPARVRESSTRGRSVGDTRRQASATFTLTLTMHQCQCAGPAPRSNRSCAGTRDVGQPDAAQAHPAQVRSFRAAGAPASVAAAPPLGVPARTSCAPPPRRPWWAGGSRRRL